MFAFLVRERRRFASGSDRDNSGDPRGDLCLDQFFESRIVNGAIAKWRDQRSKDAPKHVTNCRTTYSIVMSSEVETFHNATQHNATSFFDAAYPARRRKRQ